MECLSCKTSIDLKWKHAIENNLCPLCGDKMMDDEFKNNFSLLREVMDSIKSNLPSIETWLFENYDLLVYNSDLYKSKLPRVKQHQPTQQIKSLEEASISHDDKLSEAQSYAVLDSGDQDTVNKYFDNAEASSVLKRQEEIKEMISKIKSETKHQTAFSTVDSDLDDLDLDGGDYSDDYDDMDAEIPPALLSRAGGASAQNQKDLALLRRLQNKSKSAAGKMKSGGGSFSR